MKWSQIDPRDFVYIGCLPHLISLIHVSFRDETLKLTNMIPQTTILSLREEKIHCRTSVNGMSVPDNICFIWILSDTTLIADVRSSQSGVKDYKLVISLY